MSVFAGKWPFSGYPDFASQAFACSTSGTEISFNLSWGFRSQQVEFLERLLVDSVAALINQGLVPLEMIAQDGMRVRASAGSSSFRRKPTLEKLQQEAQRHLEELKRQNENEAERQAVDAIKQLRRSVPPRSVPSELLKRFANIKN